ncbi:hypothetical protein KZ829_11270 [Actinoplanes hulinensis]|uniref:Adhesin domain-containing protein n=1 Tax=Actinoplanes hulinensis TaxID=1144547 RepID=A0ABS7AZV0_9ACTN|nr:hypothetical protein [Actinoplanes hulinensis]MBW6434312.1 hypothetical protein [Actinoplanes hulinensis]
MDSPVVPTTGDPAEPVELPDIAEYWPDAPHRTGPPADHYELDGAEAVRTDPAWNSLAAHRPTLELTGIGPPPPRPLWRPVLPLLAGMLVIAGTFWVIFGPDQEAERSQAPVLVNPPAAVPASPPVSIGTSPPVAEQSTAPPVPAPAAATFELAEGTTELDVRIGDPGEGWFAVSTPQDSGIEVRTVVEGTSVRVFVDEIARGGSARIDVVLSPEVVWSVLMRGGVRVGDFDLTDGRVGRVDLLGGARRIELALPRQDTVVPISMGGGVRDWKITTDGKTRVRAVLQRGAGEVDLYGDRDRGVDSRTVFTVGDGDGGIDLVAAEGVGTLTVEAG